jgi:hypothetical protein
MGHGLWVNLIQCTEPHLERGELAALRLDVGLQVAFASKGVKPGNHFICSRVGNQGALSSYGATGLGQLVHSPTASLSSAASFARSAASRAAAAAAARDSAAATAAFASAASA